MSVGDSIQGGFHQLCCRELSRGQARNGVGQLGVQNVFHRRSPYIQDDLKLNTVDNISKPDEYQRFVYVQLWR
jgi:hypothetical protein